MTRIKDLLEKNWHEKKEDRLKCLESLFQKTILFYIISTSLWFLYLINSESSTGISKNLTDFLYAYWVKPIFSKIETGSIPLWFIIGLTVLIGLYFIAKALRQYVYSRKSILFYFVLILNYSLLRFTSNTWEIKSIAKDGFLSHFAYWDLVFLLIIPIVFYSIKKLKSYSKKPDDNSKGFYLSDDPLEEEKDIFPDRVIIAKKMTESIISIKSQSSFAIGITSPWGNGKTTFLQFLIKKLKEKDDRAIYIEFSPWYCKSEADIISLFFDSLSDGLKPYHSSINNQIEKYAKLLLSTHKNPLSGAINKAFDLFSEPKDVRSIYEQIDTSICNLDRKVYISIDDLDRLYAKEIIECFKIIRNTANFKNVIFILAYSSEYVDKALKEALKDNHEGYIDKIIQLEYELPEIEHNALIKHITDELKKQEMDSNSILKQKYYKNSEKDNISVNKNHELDIIKYFTNIRDCNKILNIFFTYRRLLGDEVIQSELFLVCMLKTLYPNEAFKIYLNLDEFFTFEKPVQFKDLAQLENFKKEKENNNSKIKPRYKIDGITPKNDTLFKNLVQAIFLRPEPNIRSAAMHNNFETYYNGVVSEKKIKYTEFIKWIVSAETLIKQIDFLNKIGTDLSNDKLDNLNEKLSDFTPQNKDQAQIILHGLFYLDSNLNAVIPMLFNYKDDSIEILNRILDSKLEIPLRGIARSLADIKFSIIDSGDDSDYKRAFNLVKIQVLSIKALIKKITTEIIDTDSDYKDLLDIYWNCFLERTEKAMKIDPIANKLMKDFAQKHAVSFIKNLEMTPDNAQNKHIRQFHYSIDQIFSGKIGEYEPFEDFLKETVEKNPDDAGLKQIDEYWDAFKKSGYKYYELKDKVSVENKMEVEVIN